MFTLEDERRNVYKFIRICWLDQLKLNFKYGTLVEAYRWAFDRRKPLAVYLHDQSSSIRILDYSSIQTELNTRFILFPWDCSTLPRRKYIQTRINEGILCVPEQISSYWLNPLSLPCLVVIGCDSRLNPRVQQILSIKEKFVLYDKLKTLSFSFI